MLKDIFFFINPLSQKNLEVEKNLLSHVNTNETHVHFIPIINLRIVNNFIKLHPRFHGLDDKNNVFKMVYDELLAFKAAEFQGAKKARQFLMLIQEETYRSNKPLSENLILNCAYKVNLDIEMFTEDWHSDLVHEEFIKDLQFANKMNIKQTPATAVV